MKTVHRFLSKVKHELIYMYMYDFGVDISITHVCILIDKLHSFWILKNIILTLRNTLERTVGYFVNHYAEIFFNCYLAAPQPTLDHDQYNQGNSLTNPMLINRFYQFRPEGHQDSCSKVGFLSAAKHLVRFESGPFQF